MNVRVTITQVEQDRPKAHSLKFYALRGGNGMTDECRRDYAAMLASSFLTSTWAKMTSGSR